MKQINIFIEMVICLAVGCKSDATQGQDYMFMNFQGKKIWNNNKDKNIKIKCRSIQSTQQARMNHAYCVSVNRGLKKMIFQLALNKAFCTNPQLLTYLQLKQRQRTKINKAMLSASLPPPIGFPHKVHSIRIEK